MIYLSIVLSREEMYLPIQYFWQDCIIISAIWNIINKIAEQKITSPKGLTRSFWGLLHIR